MTELKPCPFCGAPGELVVTGKYSWGYSPEFWSARCTKCKAQTAEGKEGHEYMGAEEGALERIQEQAALAWNTRVSPWRSLKDYAAPADADATIVLRRTSRLAWLLCGPLGRRRTIELAIADGFDEYMELPE